MPASTDPTVAPTSRYEPFVDVHRLFAAECPCNWSGELRTSEAAANADADNHRIQHVNEVIWPAGMEVRWAKRTGRNGDTVEWWKGTIVRHSGVNVVIRIPGRRPYEAVSAEDLRKP